MKRFLGHVLFAPFLVGAVSLLGGCPIYGSDHGGYCSDSYYDDDDCVRECSSSYDCASGYTCSRSRCVVVPKTPTPVTGRSCMRPEDCPRGENCGTDNKCHVGDCSNSGCPTSYVCKLAGGTLQCVSGTTTKPDSGPPFTGCKNDGACTSKGAGAKCLNGDCVAAADQCSDATQCPGNSQCVQGVCTPSCDAAKPCPTGYACDTSKGVCTGNPTPCGPTSSCSSTTKCVQERCVTPCGAGNTCQNGLVCVDGGCIPDQKPQFVCVTEGQKDACATGSICLHHSCYIGCSADAGAEACKAADKFNQCKQVATSTGTYAVCGSSSNLGTECDPTQSRNCASPRICIDGFCR